jgi:spore germination protein
MFSRITSFVLMLALVVAGFWGYREHKEKQALLIKAENQYQRAFHDLSDHMNRLQDELGKSLVINSKQQRATALTETWRLAAESRNDIGQLPLSLMPFNKTMEFITDVGNFSYRVAVRDDDKQKLSDQEWNTLQQLYNRSKGMEKQMTTVQSAVLSRNLRWMDAELALAQTDKKSDNQIVDGFRSMEKSMRAQKTLSFGPTLDNLKTRQKPDVAHLQGKEINEAQAAQKVQQWLGLPNTQGITAVRNGKGNLFPSFTVTVAGPNGVQQFFTLTTKGGYVTQFQNPRDVKGQSIDLDQGSQYAMNYLKQHGIAGNEVVQTSSYDNVGVYDLVPNENGVRIYPDKVTVEIALDNGQVRTLNAQDYVFHHRTRQLPQAKVTQAQASKLVSPKVSVQETRLAVIMNDLKQEVLAWEFVGTMDQDTYKIYISAIDGKEIGVEKLR